MDLIVLTPVVVRDLFDVACCVDDDGASLHHCNESLAKWYIRAVGLDLVWGLDQKKIEDRHKGRGSEILDIVYIIQRFEYFFII